MRRVDKLHDEKSEIDVAFALPSNVCITYAKCAVGLTEAGIYRINFYFFIHTSTHSYLLHKWHIRISRLFAWTYHLYGGDGKKVELTALFYRLSLPPLSGTYQLLADDIEESDVLLTTGSAKNNKSLSSHLLSLIDAPDTSSLQTIKATFSYFANINALSFSERAKAGISAVHEPDFKGKKSRAEWQAA